MVIMIVNVQRMIKNCGEVKIGRGHYLGLRQKSWSL
jgi:hypothetical protein